MNSYQDLLSHVEEIERRLGYSFQDRSLLCSAFIHKSYYNEHRDVTGYNERLEFLGDSVLNLLISCFLYQQHPQLSEGDLSHLRSYLVDSTICLKFVEQLGVEGYVLLGRGAKMTVHRSKESIRADLFEAILASIFLDGGLEAAYNFFWSKFLQEITSYIKNPVRNWKAELQEHSQKHYQVPPSYIVLSQTGPDHSKTFEIAVYLNEQEVGRGTGCSKKEAEQQAAKSAILSCEEG